MGGQPSRPIPPAPPRAPPPQQDTDDDEDDQKCRACFFLFPAPKSASGSNATRDLIGSPLPDTPLFERKKRENVKEALQRDKEVFLSKYGGMEKELFLSPNIGSNGRSIPSAMDNDDEAKIYEGPDCEKLLHEKYELLEVVGVGSTSTVHRCVKKSTGEVFACKVIDCAMIEERFQGMMAQFQVEIEALRQLQHPGIIRLYDVYIPENKIFIVMENMEGGELFDYVVQKGTLTEDEAAKIVQKVTSALVFMHSKNICHRDLKPENLLLKQKPKGPNDDIDVKIIDFGLSKAMEEPIARTFLGTRGYLAPEVSSWNNLDARPMRETFLTLSDRNSFYFSIF
jgi:tRNA A-37 threonylcarbamoyl transferase component Bud32